MKDFLKDIKNDKTISFSYFADGFFIIAVLIFIALFYNSLPPFVPIFNQLPWGEQRLGSTITIFIPVLTALLILIINTLILPATYRKIPLLARMLASISLLAGILSFLFVIKTIILML